MNVAVYLSRFLKQRVQGAGRALSAGYPFGQIFIAVLRLLWRNRRTNVFRRGVPVFAVNGGSKKLKYFEAPGYRTPVFAGLGLAVLCLIGPVAGWSQQAFPFESEPLTEQADLSVKMVAGVDELLLKETERFRKQRGSEWKYDFSSAGNFQRAVAPQKEWLARRLGIVEQRLAPRLELVSNSDLKWIVAEAPAFTVNAVRWQVIEGMPAEGLLLRPKGKAIARIVMVPDADVLPEVLAGLQQGDHAGFGAAQQLAGAGWEVLIPVLVSRDDRFSGNASLGIFTNQPHREWIYRQSYDVGRHVIGYELQKIFAGLDWFESRNKTEGVNLPLAVAGHGEGGLLALYATALDNRISSTLISGYFDARERLWEEPIYRNVFGLLTRFSDAELAAMAWPRAVTIEYALGPEVEGPPKAAEGRRSGAAPGRLSTPQLSGAKAEWERAVSLVPKDKNHLHWVGGPTAGDPFSPAALSGLAKGLDLRLPAKPIGQTKLNVQPGKWINAEERQGRAVQEMEAHVQGVLDTCHRTRDKTFWSTLKGRDPAAQVEVKAAHRKRLAEVLGTMDVPLSTAKPKARLLKETDKWTRYEITLDVRGPGLFAWGILTVPKNIPPGKKMPAVVCQHGLEGVPSDLVNEDTTARAWFFYRNYATKLAEQGYVTFAPHNPYRGQDKFRVLQRKGNPIGLTLFSIITAQHRRIVDWLGKQSFIDPSRIGFYGLSYGGKTAMRVPALVEGYALSICSADFNEWVLKCSTTDFPFSYMFTLEYDMPEWDLGSTFNYAEMAALIAPRPFMVERGHHDGVGVDEWVDFEFAKVRRHFVSLQLPGSVSIEHFDGPHSINGKGTFEFLDQHLKNR